MLFHQSSQKIMRKAMIVVGILMIISMVLLYIPIWNY